MAESAQLQIVLRLKDEASRRMKGIDNSFRQSMARISNAAAGGAMVAGAAFAGVGKVMVGFADQVKEAENILRFGTGAMGEDLDALMDAALEVGAQVPQDFDKVAGAIADVNTEFGLIGDPLAETTRMFLDIARIADKETGPMIKGLSDIMAIFGDDQSEINTVMGDFIGIAQDTGHPLEKLIDDMTRYGPILKNAGMRTDEAAAFIGVLERNGIDVGPVMEGLGRRMKDLADKGVEDLNQALMKDIELIANTENETAALSLAAKLFGPKGGDLMVAAIKAGLIPAHEALIEKIGDTDDEVKNLTANTMTISEEFRVLKNKLQMLVAPWEEEIALLGAILLPLGLAALAFGGLALAVGALGLRMAPVLIGVAVVVAAVALAVFAFKNWEAILETLKDVFNSGFGWLLPGGPLLKALFLLRDNWDTIWNGMKAVVSSVARPIVAVINGVIGGFNALFDAMRPIELGWGAAKKFMGKTVLPGFSLAPFRFLPTIPEIPTFAMGGIVTRPTLAQIGEAGPEAIVPLRAGGGLLGTNITINFPVGSTVFLNNEASARSLADQITQQIRGILRAQGTF